MHKSHQSFCTGENYSFSLNSSDSQAHDVKYFSDNKIKYPLPRVHTCVLLGRGYIFFDYEKKYIKAGVCTEIL